MTVIEFLDDTPISNVLSIMTPSPDRIIYIGDNSRWGRVLPNIRAFARMIGRDIPLELVSANLTSLSAVTDALDGLVAGLLAEGEEFSLDLTGGSDLALVAAGIVFEKYKSRGLQLHRYNSSNGRIHDCDMDGKVIESVQRSMSVEEAVVLHGGTLLPAEGASGWDLNSQFVSDIFRMWDICRVRPGRWNYKIGVLNKLSWLSDVTDDPLKRRIHVDYASEKLGDELDLGGVFLSLRKAGMLTNMKLEDGVLSFGFKNAQIQRVLSKAGTLFELVTYISCLDAVTKKKEPLFTGGVIEARIGWDSSPEPKVTNEVDVIMMRDLTPVFISCKNGEVGSDELYKLNTVAERFGGHGCRKLLFVTDYGGADREWQHNFVMRAEAMDITVADGLHKCDRESFSKHVLSAAMK